VHVRAASEKMDAYNNNNDKNKNFNKWCVVCVSVGIHDEQVDSVGALDASHMMASVVVFTAPPCSPQHHGHAMIRPQVESGVFVAVIESERVHVHSPPSRR
jgi:hypothetical protein